MGIATPLKALNSEQVKLEALAHELNVDKSTVSKLSNKTLGDIHLRKLKRFVEATGGLMNIEIILSDGTRFTV